MEHINDFVSLANAFGTTTVTVTLQDNGGVDTAIQTFDITIIEIAHLIAKVVGFTGKLEFDATKPDGTPRKLLDVSKLRGLGWSPKIGLEDGLRQTYAWFVEQSEKHLVRG